MTSVSMLRTILERCGVVLTTILVSATCILLTILISVGALLLTGNQDWGLILLLSVVCPACIAPPIAYSYSRVLHQLEASQTNLQRELEARDRASELALELEIQFRQVLEHTSEAFFMATPTFRKFYYVSSAYETIWGRSIESLYASPASFLRSVYKHDRAKILKEVTAGFRNQEHEFEYRIVRPDGELRWIRSRLLGVEGSGANRRTVGFSEDITERKQAEGELEIQRAQSMRADRLRSLGEMAAGIAHELNQPLVGVRGLAEHSLIGMDRGWQPEDPTSRERFGKIIEQVDRMVNIVDHVRLFAGEAGKAESSTVNINEVVRSSVELIRTQMQTHGVSLECKLADGLPTISANPYSLEEVVINLINNARESIEDRRSNNGDSSGGHVRICTRFDGEAVGKRVEVVVSDDGIGMPVQVLERAFDPFFTTKPPDKGTGLGLSVSRSIVEQFGGEIELRSNGVGGGATVRFSIPVGVAESGVGPTTPGRPR